VRFDGRQWREVPPPPPPPEIDAYQRKYWRYYWLWADAIAAAREDELWIVHGASILYSRPGALPQVAHTASRALFDVAVAIDEAGVSNVWAVGGGSSLFQYQAPGRDVPLPQVTATSGLPISTPFSTPTPGSLLTRTQVEERAIALTDMKRTGAVRAVRADLISAGSSVAFLDWWGSIYIPPCPAGSLLGVSGGSECRYGWHAVWRVEVRGPVTCYPGYGERGAENTIIVYLDAADGAELMRACYFCPTTSRLRPYVARGAVFHPPTPTPIRRNLTPQAAAYQYPPCPTPTPWYEDGRPYP
jgi:hypothetical protein